MEKEGTVGRRMGTEKRKKRREEVKKGNGEQGSQ